MVEISDSGQEVQEVGSLKGGLLAMAASPDGELLLLATGLGQLLVMTQDWDLLYEVSLDKDLAAAVSTPSFDRFGLPFVRVILILAKHITR